MNKDIERGGTFWIVYLKCYRLRHGYIVMTRFMEVKCNPVMPVGLNMITYSDQSIDIAILYNNESEANHHQFPYPL